MYRWPVKRQPHKMIKHTQTINRQKPTNYLNVFDHFLGLALERLKFESADILLQSWRSSDRLQWVQFQVLGFGHLKNWTPFVV